MAQPDRPRVHRSAAPLLALLACLAGAAAPATRPTTAPDELVSLNLAEGVPLRVLIDYVSQEFGVNIVYDDQLASRQVTVKAPERLPRSALPALLESALKANGLALIDAEQKGWKRIVPLAQAARPAEAPFRRPEQQAGPSAALTQVFRLNYVNPAELEKALKPFLSGEGASAFSVEGQGLLVVTDYATNVGRIADLIRAIDQPSQQVGIEFIGVKFADASRLTQQLDQLLRARIRAAGGGDRAAGAVEVTYDGRTNQVVVIAPKDRMDDARQIARELDVSVPTEQSPVRFYKLANATAGDVLATIRSLEGEGPESPTARPTRPSATGRRNNTPSSLYPDSTTGPRLRSGEMDRSSDRNPSGSGANAAGTLARPGASLNPQGIAAPLPPTQFPSGAAPEQGITSSLPRESSEGTTAPRLGGASALPNDLARARQAKVTADPNTNSIIVVGPPDVQRLYEQLIRTLDKRRPQVLIEARIVTVDTTGNFQLGVELSKSNGADHRVITFSSFGLSDVDATTGRLALKPGLGFNGTLISSDVADVVIRALESNTRARVSAAPRILVNDNSLGTLTSIVQFPYASVNASTTVATTSFGNYAEAGTQISVTPHISEEDYLQLEYVVSLSSFTGDPIAQGGTLLPPARKEDSVESTVTIPDGATIVVGGLNRRSTNETKDAVPLLGRIPILEYLFSNRTAGEQTSTLFVFLRPVILRDDQFADLKFLSEQDARGAALPPDLPASEPLALP